MSATSKHPKPNPQTMNVINMILIGLVCSVLGFMVGYRYALTGIERGTISRVTNYEECVKAGYPVQESYPPKCSVPGGQTFTQNLPNVLPVEPDGGIGNTPDEGVYCTMDAKECPDGSFVGRSGPKCEFAPCPRN